MIQFFLIWLVKLFFPRYWTIPTSLIYAQAKHETGNFTSSIFKENKNLFGMKQSFNTKGGFIETGTSRGHAVYKNWFDSIRDYFIRQKNGFNIKALTVEKYINETLNSNYAEDKNYKNKWLNTYNSLPVLYKYLTWVLLPTIAIVFLYFLNKQNFKILFWKN